jgi:hypothetical protein
MPFRIAILITLEEVNQELLEAGLRRQIKAQINKR